MRGIQRFLALLLLVGGLAGAAAFAHRAGSPPNTPFTAPFARPVSHRDSSSVLRARPLPEALVKDIESKNMDKDSPILVRLYKEESEIGRAHV